jgi:hypothetical protein
MNYREIYKRVFAEKDTYRLSTKEMYRNRKATFDFVLDWLRDNSVTSLVDVGSGRGTLLELVHTQFPKMRLTAVDLEDFTKKHIGKFIRADLSLERDRKALTKLSMGVVTCLDVLEHLEIGLLAPVLKTFTKISEKALFAIAVHKSPFIMEGRKMELHKIIKRAPFWRVVLSEFYWIEGLRNVQNGRLILVSCRRRES